MTINKSHLRKISPKWLGITAIATLAFLALSLWLPYGFNFAGFGDEWPMLTLNDMGTRVIGGTLRPFVDIPSFISYKLSPDSFVGMNILIAIMTFGRGVGIYYLLRRLLPQHPDLALVGGGLAVVYMGDIAFYALVVVSITTALVAFLVALLALMDYWQRPRWYIIILMWATLAFSIGIYEVSYPLILAAPLLLLLINAKFNWRLIKVALLWYVVPALYLAINLFARLNASNLGAYQLSIVKRNITLPDIAESFAQIYIYVFGRVWQTADKTIPQEFSDGRVWLVVITTLVMGMALFVHRSSTPSFSFKKGFNIISVGLIGLSLGFAPYTVTIFSRSGFRTLFYALPFAAMALATLVFMLIQLKLFPRIIISILFGVAAVYFLLRAEWLAAFLTLVIAMGFISRYEWRYAIVGAALVGFAGATTMGFHEVQPYSNLPAFQQQLATTIAKQAPAIKSNSLILWIGTPGTAQQYTIIRNRSDIFQAIMRFIYKQPKIEARMCNPDGSETGDLGERCRLEKDAVVIDSPADVNRWSYDRVIAFTYELDKGAVLLNKIPPEWMSEPGADTYDPEALIDHDAPLPYRLGTVWTNTGYSVADNSRLGTLPDW